MTQNTILGEINKYTRLHQLQKSQEFTPFPAGDKAASNRQDSMTRNTNDPQNTALERSVRNDGTNLILKIHATKDFKCKLLYGL